MFKQGGGGWQHYVSQDFVGWSEIATIIPPGGWDGSLTLLKRPSGTIEPVILYDCTSVAGCRPAAAREPEGTAPTLGDPPIIGVARPADPSDPNLTVWVKDSQNPIYITGAPPTYSGPSNLWVRADGKVDFVMILGRTTGLFQSTDPTLHNWTLVNATFFPTRGGGGGMFFPLPAPGGGPSGYTHMLQSDFHSDGTGFYALGRYNEDAEVFDNLAPTPGVLDYSGNFRFIELGYREDGTMVNSGWVVGMGVSITRVVSWDPQLETLLVAPVPEVTAYHEAVLAHIDTSVPLQQGTPKIIVTQSAQVADVVIVIGLPSGNTSVTLDLCSGVVANISVSAADSTGRRTATVGGTVPTMIGNPTFELKQGEETLEVRALLDVGVTELFLAGGRAVITSPGVHLAAPGVVSLTAGSDGVVVHNATAWAMGSI